MPRLELHPDRLLPSDRTERAIARELYATVSGLPALSPHGHIDPSILATNEPFSNPTDLLVAPDHYIARMLYSQGVAMEQLGMAPRDEHATHADPREAWRRLADHWAAFRGTPSRLWLDAELHDLFGVTESLSADSADRIYDRIAGCLEREAFRPRALFERFTIEALTTTESAVDDLRHHRAIGASDWDGRVLPAFRPDSVIDPDHERFAVDVARLGEITGEDTSNYAGYLAALQLRRKFFIDHGCTSTDHGHPSAITVLLDRSEAMRLYSRTLHDALTRAEAEAWRGHMLMEMAAMSIEDGLVMQLHPGAWPNHNALLFERFGRDSGGDIPTSTDYVRSLHALLNRFGNDPRLTLVVFTLDESVYSRELAPLAGLYPAMLLGHAWWFHDSPEGLRRYFELVVETAGFYNTAGFTHDARAFASIPARFDTARRIQCGFLARLVAQHRLPIDEAHDIGVDLAYRVPKRVYRL